MPEYIAHELNGGYYAVNVRMHVDARLKNHQAAQCGIDKLETGEILFYSYSTLAAKIDENGFLFIYCTCSRTTVRQISWFIKEYAQHVGYISPAIMRDMQDKKYGLNIYTGETTN